MSATALFPMYFLKSFAYAGVATVAFVATASIVITPAAIVLLGPRLDALDVRRLVRRLLGRPDPVHKPVKQLFWYRSSKFVMRRWLPVGTAVVALLVLLGLPFLSVKWGFPDDRVLPRSASARQVGDILRDDFGHDPATQIPIVVPDARGLGPVELDSYAAELSRVPDVSAVAAPTGTFVDGSWVGTPRGATGLAEGSAFLTVSSTAPLFSRASDIQLKRLHQVAGPAGRSVVMAGVAQVNRDSVDAVTDRLPMVLGLIAAITYVLLFLLTGSVVLPAKALVCNVLSLTAAFGALVWIFQEGPFRCPGNDSERDVGGEYAGPTVLHRIRFVHGLRGVSGLQDSGVLVGIRSRATRAKKRRRGARRQRRERRARRGPHRSGDHRGSVGDVHVVRRVDRCARVVHADVRPRPDFSRGCRRHTGADGRGPSIHACDGPLELVGTETPGVAA